MSMHSRNIASFFLDRLKLSDVEAIKNDIRSVKNGVELFYVVDTYDIINYFLPFLDDDFYKEKNIEYLANDFIVYEKVFSTLTGKVIIPNEYIEEIWYVRDKFEKKLNQGKVIHDRIRKVVEDVSNIGLDVGNQVLLYDLLIKNFNIIVFLLMLVESKNNSFATFFELISNMQYDNDEEGVNVGSIYRKLHETNSSNIGNELYNVFVDTSRKFLLNLDNDVKRYNYLKNAFTDIEVIDKILGINKNVLKNRNSKIVYLSSTPYKTVNLFQLLRNNRKLNEIKDKYDVRIERNAYQIFLTIILLEKEKENVGGTTNILNSITSYVKRFKNSNSSHIGENTSSTIQEEITLELLTDLIENISQNIDNFLLSHIKSRQMLTDSIAKLKKEGSIKEISEIISSIDLFIKNKDFILLNENTTQVMSASIEKYKQSRLLLDEIKKKNISSNIVLPRGQDIISNPFHHLPVLLFIQNTNSLDVYELFDKVSSTSNKFKEEEANIIKITQDIIKSLTTNSLEDDFDKINSDFLVLSFLSIIALPSISDNYSNEHENDILQALKRQRRLYKDSNYETNKLKSIRELNYMMLWLKRRNIQKIDECIDFGIKILSNYEDDPRIHHGIGIAKISKGYQLLEVKNYKLAEKCFNEALIFLNPAKEKYEQHRNLVQSNIILDRLIVKNKIAIRNSITDITLKIYGINNKSDFSLLEDLRKEVKEIKKLFKLIGENYEHYTSVNHTETELEYFEAKHYFEIGNNFEAKKKIKYALERLRLFKKYKPIKYPKIFNEIESKVNLLKKKLFGEK